MKYSWYFPLVLTASKYFISDVQIYLHFCYLSLQNDNIVQKQVAEW